MYVYLEVFFESLLRSKLHFAEIFCFCSDDRGAAIRQIYFVKPFFSQ